MAKEQQVEAAPWMSIPATGPILKPREAAAYIGLSVKHFYTEAARGRVPSPFKIGVQASGVPQPWLDAVIAARAAVAGRTS